MRTVLTLGFSSFVGNMSSCVDAVTIKGLALHRISLICSEVERGHANATCSDLCIRHLISRLLQQGLGVRRTCAAANRCGSAPPAQLGASGYEPFRKFVFCRCVTLSGV